MSIWTERELRDDAVALRQLTLNVAFLADIKADSLRPRELIEKIEAELSEPRRVNIRQLADDLNHLRDELESHFALEEFYGYFETAAVSHPRISARAAELQAQHEVIFLDLCELIELAESTYYRETDPRRALAAIRAGFHSFVQSFDRHEQEERDLMLGLCNDELGVGD